MWKLLVVVICLGFIAGSSLPASAALPVEETGLLAGGAAYEINADEQGGLWISDFGPSVTGPVGEVWHVDAATQAYTVYSTGGEPADARRYADYFWWVDGGANVIGRAAVGASSDTTVSLSTWTIPTTNGYFYGATLDDAGRLWATEANTIDYQFYSLEMGTPDNFCVHPFNNNAIVTYPVYSNGFIWLGDYVNSDILRYDILTHWMEVWHLPANSVPFGMAVDAQGDLWYADSNLSAVAELDPETNLLRSFMIPNEAGGQMVAVEGERVWYTGYYDPLIGILNPAIAPYTESPLVKEGYSVLPECVPIPRIEAAPINKTTHQAAVWTGSDIPVAFLGSGHQVYQVLPDDPQSDSPSLWGIANQGGLMWVVDSGRQKLIRIESPPDIVPSFVYLPLITR